MRSRFICCLLAMMAVGASCAPAATPIDEVPLPGRTAFAFEPVEVSGVTPRWGATVAAGHLLGGMDASMAVSNQVMALSRVAAGLQAAVVGELDVPRFCGCALFDENRRELVVLGGRDDFYRNETSAVLIDVDTGDRTPIEHGGAAAHPVGCHAFFSNAVDLGYVFGGGANSSGFSADTFRYSPDTRSFARLDIAGPPARYDAALVPLADGGALLASGMGASAFAFTFHQDVWRFHASDESWSEVVTGAADRPPGRRYPWMALSPDESTLLFGFGSDSPQGESVLGDLWRLDLPSGAWSVAEVEGALPAPRGFTFRLPGPSGSAGVLAFGSDAAFNVHEDAFALNPPDELAGDWR